ncbi:hypothetical protein NDU88_002747 [Pleurodeles waltl]|uniref:Uncharacterized protein n=1 Tax=Pleurodeles waltl TaxID=8319 RepID=A0AAV7UA54_PLEWA|nr:hypothetical protein NDU88_002747 [Pleurodeles waltl]
MTRIGLRPIGPTPFWPYVSTPADNKLIDSCTSGDDRRDPANTSYGELHSVWKDLLSKRTSGFRQQHQRSIKAGKKKIGVCGHISSKLDWS